MPVLRLILLALLAGVTLAASAQRAPGASTSGEIRADIARLEAERAQLRSEATRKDLARRELEQQLESVRREQMVLDQRLAATEQQIRQLQQALIVPR
jgi:phage shock protein A